MSYPGAVVISDGLVFLVNVEDDNDDDDDDGDGDGYGVSCMFPPPYLLSAHCTASLSARQVI